MSRRPRPAIPMTGAVPPLLPDGAVEEDRPSWFARLKSRWRSILPVAALLAIQATLALVSLLQETPTIDEVVHLPAGVSYWQKRTFKLYPHNPPLVKLIAALPVVWANPDMKTAYEGRSWQDGYPNKAEFAHDFAESNATRYFEMFAWSRSLMPIFAMIGGLAVYAWSSRLYGRAGGLLSLTLWTFCPNVLAHCRLVTTDVAATSLGFAATYLFWRYLKRPTWAWAAAAGVVLGLAELTKFSLLLLYGLWPCLWLMHAVAGRAKRGTEAPRASWASRLMGVVRRGSLAGLWTHGGRRLTQGSVIVALSVLVIDAGYGFEGVGQYLGGYEFISRTLAYDIDRTGHAGEFQDELVTRGMSQRMNRFRVPVDNPLAAIWVPLPYYYLIGFDLQKLESEGVPLAWLWSPGRGPRPGPDETRGYPVYLNGRVRDSGWWYYYLATLYYKVPEGTWLLVIGSWAALIASRRSRASWADEATLLAVPAVVLGAMSFLTDINLGLRYVLPIAPYVFTSAGKLAPWALGLAGGRRKAAIAAVLAGLGATVAATASIHPHYLAYFNTLGGGPDRGSEHLVDSNLDWGQDLDNLRRWLARNAPEERVGLAYFGQVHPGIYRERGEGLDWFLPPTPVGRMRESPRAAGANSPPVPGLYAVSASLVRGLPWRVYDRSRMAPFAAGQDAFGYFRTLTPIARVGHSIFVYRITPEDAERVARYWRGPARSGPAGDEAGAGWRPPRLPPGPARGVGDWGVA